MGLDIYVRWGVATEDEDGYKKLDFPKDRWEDQLTGYEPAPHAGYLRESWGSLSWVHETAKALEAPDPYGFFKDWDGSNGEELHVDTNPALTAVLEYRDKVLRPWLRENKRTMVDKLKSQHGNEDAWKVADAFKGRMWDVIGFINFVELHRTEPNLTIIFG